MKKGNCSKCGSTQIYRSIDETWNGGGIMIRAINDKSTSGFSTEAYLCLDCSHLEIYVNETSTTLFGKGKPLSESIQASNNWEKI